MSEKKRQKKDGQRKEKKTEAMRDSVDERRLSGEPQATENVTNPEEAGLGASDASRKERGSNR